MDALAFGSSFLFPCLSFTQTGYLISKVHTSHLPKASASTHTPVCTFLGPLWQESRLRAVQGGAGKGPAQCSYWQPLFLTLSVSRCLHLKGPTGTKKYSWPQPFQPRSHWTINARCHQFPLCLDYSCILIVEDNDVGANGLQDHVICTRPETWAAVEGT